MSENPQKDADRDSEGGKDAKDDDRRPTTPDEKVDEAGKETFPASDPPSFTPEKSS